MHSTNKLVSLFAFAALTACDTHDAGHREHGPAQTSESRSDALQQRINATTPEMLSRSYQAILGSISSDQRAEFLKSLAAIMKVSGRDNTDADAAFRRQIDGKTAAAIVAEAEELHQD